MPICAGCGQNICQDSAKIFLMKEWHPCCFKCYMCGENLEVKSTIIYNGEVYCPGCFENIKKNKIKEDDCADLQEFCPDDGKNCEPCSVPCDKQTGSNPKPKQSSSYVRKEQTKDNYKFTFSIPRQLANYFNRNPIGDRRIVSPVCTNPRPQPPFDQIFHPSPSWREKNQPKNFHKCDQSCWRRNVQESPSDTRVKTSRKCYEFEGRSSCENLRKCRFCPGDRMDFEEKSGGNLGANFPSSVPCKRCGEKVYAAEKFLASTGIYHDSCFSCFCCGRCLDQRNVEESCGEVYCRRCYEHHFGFNNYGYRSRS